MQRVGVGQTGLLLGEISDANPFVGYTSKNATESKIMRNVFAAGDAWFNTGDLVRNIGYGHIQFVDRTGDTFRWKGENVSTTELEAVANTLPQIFLSTAYGVKMPGGDGRAGMLSIILGCKLEDFNLKNLYEHFQHTLPSYAVPKFIRIQKDFDYTATHKIKKVNLKKEGFDPAQVIDPLYVLLPDESAYRLLTRQLYAAILDGKYRF